MCLKISTLFLFLFLTTVNFVRGSILSEDDKVDFSYLIGLSPEEQMQTLALPYKSTMKLSATVLGQDVFSGSTVYLGLNDSGDYVALTNAHCVMPWYRGRQWIASLFLNIDEDEDVQRFAVVDIEFHPQWFSSGKQPRFDIAKLKLSLVDHPDDSHAVEVNYKIPKEFPDISLIKQPEEPEILNQDAPECPEYSSENIDEYREKVDIYCSIVEERNDSLKFYSTAMDEYLDTYNAAINDYYKYNDYLSVSVGYGLNGDVAQHFTYNDGVKRAVVSPLNMLTRYEDGKVYFIVSHPIGMHSDKTDIAIPREEPIVGELGIRYGMSGGGVYLNKKLIAINRGASLEPSNNFLGKTMQSLSSIYQNYLGKYLTALGAPMPFMNPEVGQVAAPLLLSVHQDWINAPVESNGQSLSSYLYSFMPEAQTSSSLAILGVAAFWYLG